MFAEEVPEVLKLPAPNRGNREDGIHKNGEARSSRQHHPQ